MKPGANKSSFAQRIEAACPSSDDVRERQWVYVPYDRLTDATGPLAALAPAGAGIVMMEALAKARRRPYHKKKLVLILASQRHFALEQAARGVKVIYRFTDGIFADGLLDAHREHAFASLTMMEPAEREMRHDMAQAMAAGVPLRQVQDTTWLTTAADFDKVYGRQPAPGVQKRYLMDRFYRAQRGKTGILMDALGEPLGGRYSFDEENRKPYRGQPPVPARPGYAPDEITAEAIDLVEREFPKHFGTTDGFNLPIALADVEASWRYTLEHLLPVFGPFEDAMNTREPDMFHSKTSAWINISRLLPGRLIADVEQAARARAIPLASAEGFIRQILGWREFMRHVHRVTDGYRNIAASREPAAPSTAATDAARPPEEGARPSALAATLPLPAAYWGVPSGLNCLDTVVAQVIDQGWSHHITRLMVLSNLATLCGYSPRELTDWFWIAYIDAYDWVVEPNVLGMGTFGDGGVTATKPYVSGAAYINRMSNYCGGCQYNPKLALGEGSCPFTALYWSFLDRNADQLATNPRLLMPYTTLRRKTPQERAALRARAEQAIAELGRATY
ncbi:MAG TPA: cryptochrome/photolyase family protein [Acidobacteriaceae bacterium]